MRNPRVDAELSRLENAVRNNDDKDAVNAAKNLASEVSFFYLFISLSRLPNKLN